MKKLVLLFVALILTALTACAFVGCENDTVSIDTTNDDTVSIDTTSATESSESTITKTDFEKFSDYMTEKGTAQTLTSGTFYVRVIPNDGYNTFYGYNPSNKHIVFAFSAEKLGVLAFYEYEYGHFSQTAFLGQCRITVSSDYATYNFNIKLDSDHKIESAVAIYSSALSTIGRSVFDASKIGTICQTGMSLAYSGAKLDYFRNAGLYSFEILY